MIVLNLKSKTKYYVCAYAINEMGIAYGNQVFFTTKKDPPITDSFIDTRDDRTYQTVKIGDQWWMSENLAWLPSVNPPSDMSSNQPKYYVYGYSGTNINDAKSKSTYKTYGALYNWNAANISCPNGWHLPSQSEWEKLFKIANQLGSKLKTIDGWAPPSNNDNPFLPSTNDFGFSAIPSLSARFLICSSDSSPEI